MSNPVLQKAVKSDNWIGSGVDYQRLQYPDVIIRTTLTFAVVVIAAVAAWVTPQWSMAMLFTTLGALGAVIWGSFRPGPLPTFLYAVLEGLTLGWLSHVFASRYGSEIVSTAVVATAVTFAVCLAVYRIPFVRNSNQARRLFMIFLFAYLGLSIISLLLGVFLGVGGGWGIFGMGAMGIVISAAAVGLSAWSLIVDFGDVESAVESGAPVETSWLLTLGLMVSIVWVYINMLRLLGMIRR